MAIQRRTGGTGLMLAVVAAALLLGALAAQFGGGPPRVAAKPKTYDFGSKANFKRSCEAGGLLAGSFIDTGDMTICVWNDGSRTVCDPSGNNCTDYPKPLTRPTPSDHQTGGLTTLQGGSTGATAPTPSGTIMTLLGATPVSGGSRGNPGGPPSAGATPAA